MTKATLKTLWFTGGGLLATWLAVTPNAVPPAGSNVAGTGRSTAVHQVTADDLIVQEGKLRQHLANVPLRPSTRNPFRFGRETSHTTRQAVPVPAAMPAPAPVAPSLSLSGVATDKGTRTAIISGDGQLYLVKEGEPVAGRYRVITIDSDAVTLRDDTGTDTHLVLH